jgi:diamine N-acetyltransferase
LSFLAKGGVAWVGFGVGFLGVVVCGYEARKRGFKRLTVIWEPGEDSPEEFFKRVGFQVVDETQYGEKIGAMEL